MTKILKTFVLLLSGILALYLLWPAPGFPPDPGQSLKSTEPADTESIYRRAYFTNLSRDQVTDYYRSRIKRPFIRLTVPPEFAYEFIRDQTRSSWLEEFVHPLKDSLYVNGFYPDKPTEQINIDGVHYQAKITVRYIPSHPVVRLTVLAMAVVGGYYIAREYAHA